MATWYMGRICREHYGDFVMMGTISSHVRSLPPADLSEGRVFHVTPGRPSGRSL